MAAPGRPVRPAPRRTLSLVPRIQNKGTDELETGMTLMRMRCCQIKLLPLSDAQGRFYPCDCDACLARIYLISN